MWDTDTILVALDTASRDTFLGRILRGEMISRGFGAEGQWIGHDTARDLWTPTFNREGGYTPPPALTPMEKRSIQWTEEHYREGA